MIKKIDSQLEKYDEKVGSSLNVIQTNAKGQISLADLKRAMVAIKHAPKEEDIEGIGKKLDVDSDGFVVCCVFSTPVTLAWQNRYILMAVLSVGAGSRR